MARQYSNRRIFQKRSVGFLEGEFYSFIVYFLRGNSFPTGSFGTFHSRVFYFFYGENNIIADNRRSVLPKSVLLKSEGINKPVFRDGVFFRQVVNKSAAVIRPQQSGISKSHQVSVGVRRGYDLVYESGRADNSF